MRTKTAFRIVVSAVVLFVALGAFAQDAREALGARDNPNTGNAKHPLAELMKTRTSQLRPELRGQHPRVFMTVAELATLRERARTTHKDVWQLALSKVRALRVDPPPPPAEKRRQQNEVGIGIAEAALAYRIEGDPKYLAAAKKYMDAAVSYEIWGYSWNKPNIDLAAGHLLYGLGFGYDLLYSDLTEAERAKYRDTLARHARIMATAYTPRPGRSYSYSQNHVFIPIAGLAVAAYALYDEVPDAPEWAALSRAIYDRVLATYSPDGYYYEGFEYWVFSTPWIIHYLDAHAHSTGEDLFAHPGLRNTHLYAAHILLPGGKDMFDFGDVFEGPITRAKQGEEYLRSHPGGHLHSNYNLLYRLASRYRDPQVQGVANWMKSLGHVNAEDFWTLFWWDDKLASSSIEQLPRWHYFKDHEVAFWRSGWDANATAVAFKCGPPEGHHTATHLKQFSDWHLSPGHSHPDANGFILFAKGDYLTGDSGYAGVPKTEQHNTLLVDGKGQGREGSGHNAWDDVDYDHLNRVRIEKFTPTAAGFEVVGQAAGAYVPELGLNSFRRRVTFTSSTLTVTDDIESAAPKTFSILWHADSTIVPDGKRFVLRGQTGSLLLTPEAPADARTEVIENLVTAQGRPGSVDKGEVQMRGQRLSITTASPANKARFAVTLKVQ